MNTTKEKIADALKEKGYSITRPRLLVFNALMQKHPISMKELIELLADSIDRASIYRTLQLYEKIGIVEKLHIGWKYKYELSDEFTDHHHHATCTVCHKVFTLPEDAKIEDAIHKLAGKHLQEITAHSLEIKGICINCSGK